jgi:hypothetical protein
VSPFPDAGDDAAVFAASSVRLDEASGRLARRFFRAAGVGRMLAVAAFSAAIDAVVVRLG